MSARTPVSMRTWVAHPAPVAESPHASDHRLTIAWSTAAVTTVSTPGRLWLAVLGAVLRDVVAETMRPAYTSSWLWTPGVAT